MGIFSNIRDEEVLGNVVEVDTSRVLIRVLSVEKLRKTQVGRLMVINGRPGEWLVGMVEKLTRRPSDSEQEMENQGQEEVSVSTICEYEDNYIKLVLIGTYRDVDGTRTDIFTRSLLSVPDIDAKCYALEGDLLTQFMSIIANQGANRKRLKLGKYSLEENAIAFLDANKLFQRHCALLGSTGSGKSWAVASILEQISELENANVILFDIHGEYKTLDWGRQFRIAGPNDLNSTDENVIFVPYWLLNYEELLTMFLDRTDQNAPNQAMVFSKLVIEFKKLFLEENHFTDVLENFTIDSPIPFKINDVINKIKRLNSEMVMGTKNEKQGPYFGKFDRFIPRLDAKISDKRYGFLFAAPDKCHEYKYLNKLADKFMGTGMEGPVNKGIKIIDFSEVPSDILPVIVGLIARIVFQIQYWLMKDSRHPILLICDEAHLYLPTRDLIDSVERKALDTFERIAKEGRKYGVGLFVVSQRPADINKTILSQCNNFISLRLTNADDQSVVKKLMPDSMGGLVENLPLLETGEAIVVGDAVLLPTRVILNKPSKAPNSETIAFWDEWAKKEIKNELNQAVENMRKQSK
jgi:DNA helicase HerA-like ATPase